MNNNARGNIVNWSMIETVLLDMDGTLLDKHFDDYFWEQYVPEIYAEKHGLSVPVARQELMARYQKREGTLEWTDLDFWSRELGLDIPALKKKVDHLVQVHPYVTDFLSYCRDRKKNVHLVTNAHSKTLAIKMRKTAIGEYFDSIVCSQDIGLAKEEPHFWFLLQKRLGFKPAATMLADDTEPVLRAAQEYGVGLLVYVARPSSQASSQHSTEFPSITYFNELIF